MGERVFLTVCTHGFPETLGLSWRLAWLGDISVLRSDLERVKEPRKMSYPWFALQVRSRYENIVTAHLTGMGYESFLPLYMCRRRWSDRFKEIECPLFPGYVFCRLNPLNRRPISYDPRVSLIVGMGKDSYTH